MSEMGCCVKRQRADYVFRVSAGRPQLSKSPAGLLKLSHSSVFVLLHLLCGWSLFVWSEKKIPLLFHEHTPQTLIRFSNRSLSFEPKSQSTGFDRQCLPHKCRYPWARCPHPYLLLKYEYLIKTKVSLYLALSLSRSHFLSLCAQILNLLNFVSL